MTDRTAEGLDRERLKEFFVRYGDALADGDLKTISGCYAIPSLVLSDAVSIPIATREEIEAAFDGAAERHRAQGLVAARPTIASSEALTEKLLSVDVRWNYLDKEGRSAQQDGYRYVVTLDEDAGAQISVVIATPGG